MSALARLKSRGSNLEKLQDKLKSQGGFQKDTRLWKPTFVDGKSENIIRFMPIPLVDMERAEKGEIPDVDLTAMAIVTSHAFQGPTGQWYIETSPITIGKPCPVKEYSMPKWKEAKDNDDKILKNKLKAMLPKTRYFCNILVIRDKNKPENEGKVFLYEFGNAIKNQIEKCGEKEFDTDVVFDPFDLDEGADYVMNLVQEEKEINGKKVMVPDYEDGKRVYFKQSPLFNGDTDKQEAIWKQCHSLYDFIDPAKIKEYDALKERLNKVLDLSAQAEKKQEESGEAFTKQFEEQASTKPEPSIPSSDSSESDDILDEFEKLVNGN